MGLIDAHAHLTFPELRDQVDQVLARCTAAGVDGVITVGTDLVDGRAAIGLAERYAGLVFAAVAFHPHEADSVTNAGLDALAELWDHPGVVGLGEMGLDYHYNLADRAAQRSVFASQLKSASTRDKPVVIHSREAFDDTIELLTEHGFENRRVVFHCFTGTHEEAARIAERGWMISFTGIVTFKTSIQVQAVAKEYPAEMLMIESDSPYLSPMPLRGKSPNEPARIVHTARFIAELRGVDFEDLARQTGQNTRAFFGL